MPCTSPKLRVMVFVLGLVGCSRENPIFGADGGTGDGSGSTGLSTTVGIESSVGSQSSTHGTTESDSNSGPDSSGGVSEDSSGSTSTPECGNGQKEEPEQCDDGENNGEEQFCLPDCTKNVCGDGFPAPDQPCDDQNLEPDDGCDECTLTSCGNMVVEGVEECDDGRAGSSNCTPQCTFPYCGDMIITQPEQCDDGNGSDDDECIDCVVAVCGDGAIDIGVEECDDHNTVDNDGCSAICVEEVCGDGVVQENEECEGDPGDAPSCMNGGGATVPLLCDSCEWFVEGGDCCMVDGDVCTNQVPCCPGLNCTDGGVCGAG